MLLICLFLFSELERLSNLVGKPSENHPLHNSGLLSLDPVHDKTPLYSQLLQAYKWSNKVRAAPPITVYSHPHRQYYNSQHPLLATAWKLQLRSWRAHCLTGSYWYSCQED